MLILLAMLACAQPRLLVVVTDTTRADLGGAPWPAWATPEAGARVYTAAVSPSSWTGPSTAALLTGEIDAWPAELRPVRLPEAEPRDCWAAQVVTDNWIAGRAARAMCGDAVPYLAGDAQLLPEDRVRAILAVGRRRMATGRDPVVVQALAAHLPLYGGGLLDDAPHGPGYPVAYRHALEESLFWAGDFITDAVADGYTVVWTSDHGEALGPDRWDHGLDLEDDQVRVPLVVWGPGVAPGWYDEPTSTLCIADLARGDRGLLTGGCDRTVVSAMIVDGEWVERGDL